jgi:hypothetical protein
MARHAGEGRSQLARVPGAEFQTATYGHAGGGQCVAEACSEGVVHVQPAAELVGLAFRMPSGSC